MAAVLERLVTRFPQQLSVHTRLGTDVILGVLLVKAERLETSTVWGLGVKTEAATVVIGWEDRHHLWVPQKGQGDPLHSQPPRDPDHCLVA